MSSPLSRLSGWLRRAPKMSVVVPVYNPGQYIDACVESLLGQSMAARDYEVIFVDDGSDDGTGARLDGVAGSHGNVQVVHLPNSGWPGRPRNVGLDTARGEYVYFVDHDDWLAPEALERMYAMAARNGADVIIGRIEGHGRRVPGTLFERNREQCTVADAPLMESMTPHKAFRREFLEQHRLRFPEGRRRLEDHVFVVEAYLRASVVSVLSDYTCYHHIRRDDGANAAYGRLDPASYFGNLREGIRIVEELTEPGVLRDRVLQRWYAVEMLGRVGGQTFLDYDEDYREDMVRAVRELAAEHFTSPGIAQGLPPHLVLRSELLRAGDVGALEDLAAFETSLGMEVRTTRASWTDAGLELVVEVVVTAPGGAPALRPAGGGDLQLGLRSGRGEEERSITGPPPAVSLVLRHRDTKEHRHLRCRTTDSGATTALVATASVGPGGDDPAGGPLRAGTWDLFLRAERGVLPRSITRRLPAPEPTDSGPEGAGRPEPQGPMSSYTTAAGNLSLRVEGR